MRQLIDRRWRPNYVAIYWLAIFSLALPGAWFVNQQTGLLWSVEVSWGEAKRLPWTAIECTFYKTDFFGAINGTLHVSEHRYFRGDITRQSGSVRQIEHYLIHEDEGRAYLWADGSRNGIVLEKSAIDELLDEKKSVGSADRLTCKRWVNPDFAIFKLPQAVQFSLKGASE